MFQQAALGALLFSASALACPIVEREIAKRASASGPSYGYTQFGADWADLSPDYGLCGNGTQQSPIDLPWGEYASVHTPKITVPSNIAPGVLKNTGFSPQWEPTDAIVPEITVDGETFQFLQWHTHTPISEHTVGGQYTHGEIHFVFVSGSNVRAVFGVQLAIGTKESPFFASLIGDLDSNGLDFPPLASTANVTSTSPFKLLLNKKFTTKYWTYQGSLTTPPCTQNLRWFVSARPEVMTPAQYARLQAVSADNSRKTNQVQDHGINL